VPLLNEDKEFLREEEYQRKSLVAGWHEYLFEKGRKLGVTLLKKEGKREEPVERT